jgi:phosphatidylinositol glycan class M
MNSILDIFSQNAVSMGLLIRLVVAYALPRLMDHTAVPYTDIDFYVFTDAATHIQEGGSPYDRTTYRYTPFLALALAQFHHAEYARYLFCFADTLCGYVILLIRRKQRRKQLDYKMTSNDNNRWLDSLLWLYNPLVINICTRGSAESLLVLLPVLTTIYIVQCYDTKRIGTAIASGITHGVAIHAKLYPIIYTLSFMTSFADRSEPLEPLQSWIRVCTTWTKRLFKPAPLMFGLTSMITFLALTYAAVYFYGEIALQEGLLYHFSRVDHRHNYSMHWYWIYLARSANVDISIAGRLLLFPQIILLAYSSLGVAPHNLTLALFVQTFLFVTHNKVITAQYFTWYLCLLPLCIDQFCWTRRVKLSLVVLVFSMAIWLGSAYCLEMQGMAVHEIVWTASVVFFAANVNLHGAMLASIENTNFSSSRSKKD